MLGKNQILKPEIHDGSFLKVTEIFPTIQGEGPFVGHPAIFIRLSGCNLACEFCDTNFDDFQKLSITEIFDQIMQYSLNSNNLRSKNLVVITGGEPFRQPIKKLTDFLLKNNFNVQIETNGTLFQDLDSNISIICSPKISNFKYHEIRLDMLKKISAFKFLISCAKKEYSKIPNLGQKDHDIPVYIQPMDELDEQKNNRNKELAVAICEENGYKLSLQIHKILGLR